MNTASPSVYPRADGLLFPCLCALPWNTRKYANVYANSGVIIIVIVIIRLIWVSPRQSLSSLHQQFHLFPPSLHR